MKRDNRQILVNPHSSQDKVPAGVLNLGEIGVQHNNVEDAALYVETVADSESASTVAKFITEKAIESKIVDAIDTVMGEVQPQIDSLNEEIGLPHDPEAWNSGLSVWQAIEQTYEEMTAGTAAASTKLFIDEAEGHDEKYLKLRHIKDDESSAVSYYIKSEGIDEAIEEAVEVVDDKVDELSAATQDVLDALDFTGVTQEGKPVVNVSQEDGLVNAETGNIKAEFVEVNESGDTLDEALDYILENIEANKVDSADKTIVVSTNDEGTDLSVNIDGLTLVKDADGVISADLRLSSVTPSSTNVKEEYALINNAGEQLGTSIKIYKDSSLYDVYLGHVDDVLSDPTDPESVVGGSGNTALCFIYEKTDGTYELVPVDVEEFLEESEFADGLQVNDHVVSVKIDDASEKVEISGETVDVLSVSEDGVKISGIQDAIDYAVDTLAEEVQDALDTEAELRESADTALNEAIEALEDKLSGVSVEKAESVENFVTLGVENDGNGATALTIDDSELKQVIDFINDDLSTEIAAREEAIEEVKGNSASTSADTSIMGIKKLIEQITTSVVKDINVPTGETFIEVSKEDTPEGDVYTITTTSALSEAIELANSSVQEVEFDAVAEKDETVYGSNAGAEIIDGEDGKKLVLDLSLLKIDCGDY